MSETNRPVATTSSGAVAGRWDEGVAVFQAVPYAKPPVGDRRLRGCEPTTPWAGILDADVPARSVPQAPSRLEALMGRPEMIQDEDALTLKIWTPRPDDGKRPVLVWIHGGGHMTGSGAWNWYSGRGFAERGDLVVVNVTYRQGALGYLYLSSLSPDFTDSNFWLGDLRTALRWIHTNITAFGGDPQNVTLWGQSGGGESIAYLASLPDSRPLFRRAILQSPAFVTADPPAEATRLARRFLDLLEIPPGAETQVREAPVEALLSAQGELLRLEARPGSAKPWVGPVAADPITESDFIGIRFPADLELLIGATRDESKAFAADPRMTALDEAGALTLFGEWFGGDAAEAYRTYRGVVGADDPLPTTIAMLGDTIIRIPALNVAGRRSAEDAKTWVYQFDWRSPARGGVWGAPHCLDLPFAFGNLEAWRDAPFLEGTDLAASQQLSRAMQDAWIAFARHGDPNHEGVPSWTTYDAGRAAMHFDTRCWVEAGFASTERRVWAQYGTFNGSADSSGL